VRSFRGRAEDLYLICSDGLTTMLGEGEVIDVLLTHEPLPQAGEALIAAANAAGGKDNITVVLFRLEEVLSAAERHIERHATLTALASAPQAALKSRERSSPPNQHAHLDVAVPDNGGLAGPPVTPRRPRHAPSAPRSSRGARARGRLRRLRGLVVALVVVGLLASGAYLAFQSVYFIGTNQRGLVTIFNGLPYELPGKVKLYTVEYVSGVSASTLAPAHRTALLDHSLRSESDAAELVRQLELGQLNGG
jgi:hypothetical protein